MHKKKPAISYLHTKFEQNRSINCLDTFKGRCGLCLTFDGKDHVINRSQVPISYLHAKFEQNRSIDGRDMAYLFFQGCSAFLRVHRTSAAPGSRSGKLCLSLNNHFLPSELFGAMSPVVKMGQRCPRPGGYHAPWWPLSEVNKGLNYHV